MEEQGPGNHIYLMLVTANVLRLRRQYELAEAQCSEVLRRDPRNAAAHSVLGDIARDRGDPRDAIEWYKMALDLNPGNTVDRRKLEAAIDRVYSRAKGKVVERLRKDVTDTLGSAAAEIRAARIPSALSVTLAAMVGVIMLVTILVLVLGRGGAPAPAPAAAEAPAGGFAAPLADPLEPKPIDRNAGPASAAAESRFGEDVASLEAALLEDLRAQARIVDPQCQLVEAEIDPRDGMASVEFSMPRLWSVEHTRNGILRVALPLAIAAADWDERFTGVRVRCSTRQEGLPDQLAFVAQVDAGKLVNQSNDPRAWDPAEAFSSIWWDPQMRPDMQVPPSPGAR
ncbi:MAG TPA: tetratricopeptide repeat protein [Armatimonadota bacterium]|nr:tetratricopeptide repeat protein [Armatimonadota bacterium]